MIFIAVSNLLLIIIPPNPSQIIYLGSPFGVGMLTLQILFYGLAWLGGQMNGKNNQSKIKKILYLSTFLVNSNIAALKGFTQFIRGQESHIWERIQRR